MNCRHSADHAVKTQNVPNKYILTFNKRLNRRPTLSTVILIPAKTC